MAFGANSGYTNKRRRIKGPPAKPPAGLQSRKLGGGGVARGRSGLNQAMNRGLGAAGAPGTNNSALGNAKANAADARARGRGLLADQRVLAQSARRRIGPPNALGQRALIGGARGKAGDRIVGAGVNRSMGNRIQTGPSARHGQKFRIGVTPQGRVVHLYGSGRGKDRVVLGAGFKPPAAANPIMERYGTPRQQASAANAQRRRRRATARR